MHARMRARVGLGENSPDLSWNSAEGGSDSVKLGANSDNFWGRFGLLRGDVGQVRHANAPGSSEPTVAAERFFPERRQPQGTPCDSSPGCWTPRIASGCGAPCIRHRRSWRGTWCATGAIGETLGVGTAWTRSCASSGSRSSGPPLLEVERRVAAKSLAGGRADFAPSLAAQGSSLRAKRRDCFEGADVKGPRPLGETCSGR